MADSPPPKKTMRFTGSMQGADGREYDTYRDSYAREWAYDPKTNIPHMTPDSVATQKANKADPRRVVRGERGYETPSGYSQGGSVRKVGCQTKGHTKGKHR